DGSSSGSSATTCGTLRNSTRRSGVPGYRRSTCGTERRRRCAAGVTTARLDLSREQILAFRRSAGALDERLPPGGESLRRAAWAGLQDSMPRAALLSIHARVAETGPTTWEDPALVQLWGPRYSAYIVAAEDVAPFTLGRLPDDTAGRRRAEQAAARLHSHLDGRKMTYGEAGHALGVNPNSPRYGTTTGAPARLLPSGDAYFLLHGADRELLVPDAAKRGMLWTSRVWPGAILVEGEIVGVWRRAGATISLQPWQSLSSAQRNALEAEA